MSALTRRAVLVSATATAATTALWSVPVSSSRQPVVYLPHGGGPWPWMNPPMGGPGAMDRLRGYLEGLKAVPPEPPRAILMISAHWEEAVPTVSTSARPPMLYDYSGFPADTYRISWPAPGEPALAARVRALLASDGIASAEDPNRGFDHGTFVPLGVAWPEADIPTVQLSLVRGLDPALHLKLGRALAPLRDEGVFIVGSGMSYHDMRGFGTAAGARSAATFDAWLDDVVTGDPARRDAALLRWAEAPAGRSSHPREEHLLPLVVIAGAAGSDAGRVPFSEAVLGTKVSAVHFG